MMCMQNYDCAKEKQDEFIEIVSSLAFDINKYNGHITEGIIGRYFLEFSSCQKLFEVLYSDDIPTGDEVISKLEEDGSFPMYLYKLIVKKGTEWYNTFKKALEKYISLNDNEILKNVISSMLNYVSNDGEDELSSYSIIYYFLKNNYIGG